MQVMYVVVSKWEYDPAYEAEVRASASLMMQALTSWPEVAFAYNVRAGDGYVLAIVGYRDEDSYRRLVQEPNGPFEKAAAEHGIERLARWIWSERGVMEQL